MTADRLGLAGSGVAEQRMLVERARSGDRIAFGRLLEPRLPGLYRTAFAILRHEADANDAVQQACLAAWRELPRLRDPDRFDAWLGRTVLNRCRMTLRAQRRRRVREIAVDTIDREPADRTALPSDRLAELDAIRAAFEHLSADHRTVLVLHHVEQRPLAEIAPLLGVAVGTVKWRLHEARQALRRALESESR